MSIRTRLLPLAAVLVLSLSACATIEGWFSNPSSTAALQTATTLAVGEAILSAKDAAAQKQLADDILSVTATVQAAVTGNTTVAALVALVQAKLVGSNLNPQQLLAANTLLTFLSSELQQKVGTGILNPQDVVIFTQFTGWVTAAATPYG